MQIQDFIQKTIDGADGAKIAADNTVQILAVLNEHVKQPVKPVEPEPDVVEPEPEKPVSKRQLKPILKVKTVVTPEQFGAIGDGVTNDGPALRKAAAALTELGGGILSLKQGAVYNADFAPKGNNMRPSVAVITDNVFVDMRGATIKLDKAVTGSDHNCLDFSLANNCGVFGGKMVGSAKFSPTGNSNGEWGMGIGLYDTTNFFSDNMVIEDFNGDAFYVGRYKNSKKAGCENIHIDNMIVNNCMRQGSTVVSVDGLFINNLRVSGIEGKDPSAGIDFEPNNPDEYLIDINIDGFHVDKSEYGVLFFFLHLNSTTKPIDITINNFTASDMKGTSIEYTTGGNLNRNGKVHFTGVTTLSRYTKEALYVRNNEGVELVIDDLVCDNDGLTPTATAPVLIGTNGNWLRFGLERVLIKSLRSYGGLAKRVLALSTDTEYQPFVNDVEINIVDVEKVNEPAIFVNRQIKPPANKLVIIRGDEATLYQATADDVNVKLEPLNLGLKHEIAAQL